MTPRVALSIAGSDSGGGAGIQADMRTFAALGVFGTMAVTCVTAQNTTEVRAVHVVPPGMVAEQVAAVLDDLPVAAAKTGMLGTEAMVKQVAALAERLPVLVVDPVLVASSGAALTDGSTLGAYRTELFPLATVVTPNLLEAAALLEEDLRSLGDARRAARRLGELAPVVVVKGGHLDDPERSVDVVWDGSDLWEIDRPRVRTRNTHGSGCSFSAAIAANLALGLGVRAALEQANSFVHAALAGGAGWHLGAGPGPLDHFGWKEDV